MKIFKFKQKIKKMNMAQNEKDKVRGHILAAMNNYPVRNSNQSRHILRKAYGGNLFITKNFMYTKVIIALVILLGGGGTVAAAENSLPGSPLYPVKIHVNENVRGALAVTAEQQARWDARVIERRMQEAAKLSADGTLSAEVETELQADVKEHTESMKENFVKLESRGDVQVRNDIAAELDGVLKAYTGTSATVDSIINADVQNKLSPLLNLKSNIQGDVEINSEATNESNSELKSNSNTEIRNSVEAEINSLTAIRDEIKSSSSQVTADLKSRTKASLNTSAEVVTNAESSLKTQFDSVLSTLVNSLIALRAEVKSLLDIKSELDVNVDTSVEGTLEDSINVNSENNSSVNSEGNISDTIKSDTQLENTLGGQINL